MVFIRVETEAVYKGTNKDYLLEANALPTSAASAGKAFICPNKLYNPPYNFLHNIRGAINRNLLDAKNLFVYAACYNL